MSVRHALLALLSEGPTYGLKLREEFEARTGDVKRAAANDASQPVRAPCRGCGEGGSAAMSMLEMRGVSKTYGRGAAEVHLLACHPAA